MTSPDSENELSPSWVFENPYNVVDHSARITADYQARARFEREMVSAQQCAEVLAPLVKEKMTLLDAGCGMGHLFHSFRTRDIDVDYHGIDVSAKMIGDGRSIMKGYGLPPEQLRQLPMEYLEERFDIVVCMNTLTHLPDYHIYLEKLLISARKYLYLRMSMSDFAETKYVFDRPLDPGVDLKLYFNTYELSEVTEFIKSYGFEVTRIRDAWNNDEPEQDDVGYTYYRKVFLCTRVSYEKILKYGASAS